jgi:hypothetical protein
MAVMSVVIYQLLMLMSCQRNEGQNRDKMIANTPYENVAQLKYLGGTVKIKV